MAIIKPKFELNKKQDAIAFYIDEIESNMGASDYQRDFFESLSDQFSKNNSLSEKQFESLQKICERVTG